MGWKPADKIAVALHNFRPAGPHQLGLHVGDLLYILEEAESGEWFRGYLFYEPSRRGIFPATYVRIKESTSKRVGSRSFVVPAEDDLGLEASEALREWRSKLRELYVRGSRERWRPLLHAMEEVVGWRRAILHSSATLEALQDTRMKLSATIDEINRQLGCPLTPRDAQTGATVNYQETSVLDLWRMHRDRRADSTSDHAHLMQGTLRKKRQDQLHSHLHHLYLRVDAIDHTFPEDCEVFFFLSGGGREQLSERYLVAVEKGGEKKLGVGGERKSCVFTDLGAKDLQADMHLICQIIRSGKMLMDKKYHSTHTFRRPYACGVLNVRGVLAAQEPGQTLGLDDCQHKMTMPLYLCATNHESNFATFHTTVIQKTGARGGQKPGCAITFSLRTFHRKQLTAVRREFPTLFQATETVHKLGFPDVILPGDARNDIYVTLEGGSFSKGSKTAERNVEVAINVVDSAGKVIPNSIVLGAGGLPMHEFESFIYYHNNNPKWNETFKLCIPFEKIPDAHLRLVFRHLAKDESREKAEKSFSFAYMKIMKDDGSIIEDGPHDLFVYETGNKKWSDPAVYLSQASSREEMVQSAQSSQTLRSRASKTLRGSSSPAAQVSRSFREVVTLSTLTCSTKLTQRIELLLLLKWRLKSRDLSVVLKNVAHVGGEEVVKFLQDTLDCLFDILNDNNEKYGELVFEALVSIFGLMVDDRYHHFTTVLDIYIEKHFSALLAHKFLLASFQRNLLELMLADLQHPKLIKIIESMPYLFKFIVQSNHLHRKQQQTVEDPVFRRDMTDVFNSFYKLMSVPETRLRGVHRVQRVMMQYLPTILPELGQIFSCGEIAVFVSRFLDSVRNMDMPVIPTQKLICIGSVLQSSVRLLDDKGTRGQLVPTLVSHLISHMDHRMLRTQYNPDDRGNQEVVHCTGQLLSCLSDSTMERSFDDVQYLVPLMYPLLRLCKELSRQNKLSFPNMVNFLTLLSLLTDKHFDIFFQSQQSFFESPFTAFMQDMMGVLRSYVCNPPYPEDWCTLYLMQNKVIGRTLQNCSKALVDFALEDKVFSPSIWDDFFGLCTQFLIQPCLQLERFSDFKRHQFQQQFGDVRVTVGRHVVSLWHQLREKKGSFIPNLVKPFLEISLIKHKELRKASLPLVVDIVVCEQQASSNFKRVETEVFDKMDDLIAGGRGDEEYRELFRDILLPLCASKNLGSASEIFINSVSRLIGLLLDYRNVSSDEGHKDRRMGCMLNLLNFYREIEKEELYIRYIYKLAELHKRDQSYTEAGFTLLLRAKGLEWSIEPVPPEGRFGAEVEQMKVKEELYKEVIDLFDKGQAWEHGVPLCRELSKVYEREIQYIDLATTLQREAEFFQKMVRELRVEPEYFMVGTYGKGYPLFLRNKIFIHRGQPYERLSSFIKRLTDEYSTVELLKSTKPPGDEIKTSSGMYLQVRSVQTIPEEQERFQGKTVPDSVSRYYKANDVRKFRYDRPFHRGEKRKDCEIATLWLERTTFTTTHSFPGEMAWFEVAAMEEVELDPLAIATETVDSKTSEVKTLTALHSENRSLNINPLSMLLSGLIDAAVGGGIKNYRVVFFNDEYAINNPDDMERVQSLKQLIEEQLAVLKKGLEVHGQRISAALKGMQQNLEEKLEMMVFEVFPERRKRPVRSHTVKNVPLPPTPLEESSLKHSQTLSNRGRRLTGKNKHRISQISEVPGVTAVTGVTRAAALRRSATTITSRDAPKIPSPYQHRKHDNQLTSEAKRLSGSDSREGSVGVLSEDDLDRDTYESLEDFLPSIVPAPASAVPAPASAVPGPASSVSGPASAVPGPASSVPAATGPPRYPAPQPPEKELDDSDDHEYTAVRPTGEGVMYEGDKKEDVWAPLPLKTSPQPKKRTMSVVTSDLSPRAKHKERSPSVPSVNAPSLGSGSGSSSVKSSSSLVLPPEPTSPPPSPPAPRTPRSATSGGNDLTDGASETPQPKLPPKKRRELSKLYSDAETAKWRGSPPKVPAPIQENVYGFDKLSSPAPHKPEPPEDVYFDRLSVTPGKGNSPWSSPKASPRASHSPTSPSPAVPPTDDDVYFNHLAEPLPGKKQHSPAPPNAPPVTDDNVYFDHLVGPLPPKPHPQPPVTPQGPKEEDAPYFEHLAAPIAKTVKPLSPTKPASPMKPASGGSPDAVPPPVPMKKAKPQRQISHPEETPSERPVPRPRIGTLDRNHTANTAAKNLPPRDPLPPPPSRPPKPGAPQIPPKPSPPKPAKPVLPPREPDMRPPPRPAKSKPVT